MSRNDYYKTLSITVDNGISKQNMALVGSLFAAVEDIAIQENDDLIVLMNTSIIVIDCCTYDIKFHKVISDFGIFFSFYKFADGFIVYGELGILKLSSEFELEWSFSGYDIFVSQDNSPSFYIEDDYIYLTDWNGSRYIVNQFGKEI